MGEAAGGEPRAPCHSIESPAASGSFRTATGCCLWCPVMTSILDLIPGWLARPAGWVSTLVALGGSLLIFWSAVTGGYWWAVWGVICFVVAAVLWHLGDYASGAGRPESPGPRTT